MASAWSMTSLDTDRLDCCLSMALEATGISGILRWSTSDNGWFRQQSTWPDMVSQTNRDGIGRSRASHRTWPPWRITCHGADMPTSRPASGHPFACRHTPAEVGIGLPALRVRVRRQSYQLCEFSAKSAFFTSSLYHSE